MAADNPSYEEVSNYQENHLYLPTPDDIKRRPVPKAGDADDSLRQMKEITAKLASTVEGLTKERNDLIAGKNKLIKGLILLTALASFIVIAFMLGVVIVLSDTTGTSKANKAKLGTQPHQSDAISQLQNQVNFLSKAQNLEDKIDMHDKDLEILKLNQQNMTDKHIRLLDTIDNLKKDLQNLNSRLTSLNSKTESQATQLSSLSSAASATTTALEKIRNDVIALQTKDVVLVSQQSNQGIEVERNKNRLDLLSAKNTLHESQISQLNRRASSDVFSEIRSDIQSLEASNTTLFKMVAEQKAALQSNDMFVRSTLYQHGSQITNMEKKMGIWNETQDPPDPCHPCNISTQIPRNADIKCDCTGLPARKNCQEHYNAGIKHDGLYNILLDGTTLSVFCDQSDDGGGWTVIQNRYNGSTRFFNRGWNEFKSGFGDVDQEFYLGNDNIHQLTKLNGKLKIDLQKFNDSTTYFAKYSVFVIGDETSKYVLSVSGYSGTAGDSLTSLDLNNMKFTTYDQDNDLCDDCNCASASWYNGAWWWNQCGHSSLNAKYFQIRSEEHKRKGMIWGSLDGIYNLQRSRMKVRP